MSEKALTVFVAAAVALLVAPISPYLTSLFQRQASDRQEQRRAYADLRGSKALLRQLVTSHVEATVLVSYYYARSQLRGAANGYEFQEAVSNVRKAETLALEVARATQKLFETVGAISTFYPDSLRLRELTDRIYNLQLPQLVSSDLSRMNGDELTNWQQSTTTRLLASVEENVSKPIEDLATFIKPLVP